MSRSVIIVTGCDENHHDLAADLLRSLRENVRIPYAVGFVRVGSTELPEDIATRVDFVATVDDSEFKKQPRAGYSVAYLGIKARLPELFAGFETYIWLDADTWVQTGDGLQDLEQAAGHADVALIPECDIIYYQVAIPDYRHVATYHSLFPDADLPKLLRHQMINCGVFAARAGSALWRKWSDLLEGARLRGASNGSLYFGDQVPLHYLIYQGQVTVAPLSAVNNWQVWAAPPKVDFDQRCLRSPFWPFEQIRTVHLAGDSKNSLYRIGECGREISFRYRDVCELFAPAKAQGDSTGELDALRQD